MIVVVVVVVVSHDGLSGPKVNMRIIDGRWSTSIG